MKKLTVCGSAIALALLLAFASSVGGGAHTTTVAFAQGATPVPTISVQEASVQRSQPVEDTNDFPWGLLGLLGLAGLAGLRRRPELVRHEPGRVTPTVGMYETKK